MNTVRSDNILKFMHFSVVCATISLQSKITSRTQLFKGRLALTQGWILIQVSLFLCPRVFKGKFSPFFLEHLMIKLEAKRFELNFLLKLSDLKSNLTLTPSYLNPALNNPGLQEIWKKIETTSLHTLFFMSWYNTQI